MFERLGGHAKAAGFLIKTENEEPLREALSREVEAMLAADPALLDENDEAELEIGLSDVTIGLAEALSEIGPFGNGNPKPALSICIPSGAISEVRYLGQGGKHIRFLAEGIPFIFFGGANTIFPEKGEVRIIGCPEINEWNGRREIQFAVKHIDML
jgi:single-stranded-DNA-specific exonuclease